MVERLLRGHDRKVLLGFCIYKMILDFIYIKCQNCFNGIKELGLDFSVDRYLISWLIFLVFAVFFNYFILDRDRLKHNFSQQVLLLLLLISVAPFFTMYGAGVISDACLLYYNLFWYVLFVTIITINYCFDTTKTFYGLYANAERYINKWREKFFFIMCAFAIASIVITFFYYVGGVVYTDGIGAQAYGQREIFNQMSKNMPRLLLYQLSFANVIECMMFIYCLCKRKYICVGLLIIVLYMHFSIAAEKSVLFNVIFAVAIYFVAQKITMLRVVVFQIITAIVCLLLALCHYVYYITDWEQSDLLDLLRWLGSGMPSSLFRRAVFTPAHLQEVWFSFFEDHTPSYWGINTDYSVGPGLDNYISDIYLNSPLGHANTGLLGDCFANMGEYGVFVYPIFIAIILWCFDYVLKGKNVIMFMGLALLFANALMNSMLTTVMISHGGLVMLFMLWCFPNDAWDRNDMEKDGLM